jgi:hypothetical protein
MGSFAAGFVGVAIGLVLGVIAGALVWRKNGARLITDVENVKAAGAAVSSAVSDATAALKK